MTKRKEPPAAPTADPHDPYKMRTLEQILMLFDGGDFMGEVMSGHQNLMQDLLEHNAEHGPKGCNGTMTLQLSYAVGNSGDVGMGATVSFKAPKKPPSSAGAYINDAGELTLYSPMMKRMHQPVRDVEAFDPVTGEIRDAD
ncbi:hypothetical protein R1T40_08445 [Tritonibacter scottomollicae]|uniref:Uncharacterized protein n=1 Tax=Tritonibacter scottomollicae TaxID=483013 RepID=A0ABZ0HJ90_TRISK|nr:hypothetical protein [Tritonibacter scottomollicae]WOI34739.1 hypothetical protein R1T40_08445 [Tritonibacter scottomollicae]